MAGMEEKPKNAFRGALVSLVMFAVLLASCGAAWLLVNTRQAAGRRGAEIVQTIRKAGLKHYWGTEKLDLWYLEESNGRKTGWRNITRSVGEDGSYAGATVGVSKNSRQEPDVFCQELYQVSPDLASARYEGTVGALETSDVSALALQRLQVTGYWAQQGTITVHMRQPPPSGNRSAKGAVPPNYVPDGTTELAIRLAIERGEKVSFQFIIDDLAIEGSEVQFVHAVVTPEGPRTARVEYATPRQTFTQVYVYDEQGRVASIEDLTHNAKFELAEAEQVMKVFPTAKYLRDTLAGPRGNPPAEE
jgi:hypothetical protein